MWTVKTTSGQDVRIGSGLLERLRMLMDWQIRDMGYEPISINAALAKKEMPKPRVYVNVCVNCFEEWECRRPERNYVCDQCPNGYVEDGEQAIDRDQY